MRNAVIFGVTGQDGSYLSELLLWKGYKVIGVARRSSVNNTERLLNVLSNDNFTLVQGDVTDMPSVTGIISEYKPDECYNLAAQSHVGTSFQQPCYTLDVCAGGVLNILEAIRVCSPDTHFYQASTSEMFGNNFKRDVQGVNINTAYQDETVPLMPTSPYAIAKTAAHHLVSMYRNAYGIHASAGILFNHESERRGENFITRKITKWIGEFVAWCNYFHIDKSRLIPNENEIYTLNLKYHGKEHSFLKLRLGNIEAARDWGHAEDYVRMMWMMVNADEPGDYVVATGKVHTIREFLDLAFKLAHIDDWKNLVVIDPKFYRPSDVQYLCGYAAKAKKRLGWEPTVNFKDLVKRMVFSDIEHAKKI